MIKFLIELFFKKELAERKAKREHNATVVQYLLDREHFIRDTYNDKYNTCHTTAKAIDVAVANKIITYNRHTALKDANYRF